MSLSFLRTQKYAPVFAFHDINLLGAQGRALRVHVRSKLIDGTARRHICHQYRPCAPLKSQITQKAGSPSSFLRQPIKFSPQLASYCSASSFRPILPTPPQVFTMSTATPVEDPYRLPTNVKPIHYDITIKTDLEDLTFQGFVKIKYVYRLSRRCFNPYSIPL